MNKDKLPIQNIEDTGIAKSGPLVTINFIFIVTFVSQEFRNIEMY